MAPGIGEHEGIYPLFEMKTEYDKPAPARSGAPKTSYQAKNGINYLERQS